jgi:hypothetical protein
VNPRPDRSGLEHSEFQEIEPLLFNWTSESEFQGT